MIDDARVRSLREMIAARPEDPRPYFGLALEYERAEAWPEVVEVLRAYLSRADDEGNAFGRLALALRKLGREEEAREAYRDGIAAAERHAHPTMVMEFEEALDEMG